MQAYAQYRAGLEPVQRYQVDANDANGLQPAPGPPGQPGHLQRSRRTRSRVIAIPLDERARQKAWTNPTGCTAASLCKVEKKVKTFSNFLNGFEETLHIRYNTYLPIRSVRRTDPTLNISSSTLKPLVTYC